MEPSPESASPENQGEILGASPKLPARDRKLLGWEASKTITTVELDAKASWKWLESMSSPMEELSMTSLAADYCSRLDQKARV